jgi:hypothetical protein
MGICYWFNSIGWKSEQKLVGFATLKMEMVGSAGDYNPR